jgi:hypothetical protein
MHIHPHDDIAARTANALVQTRRLDLSGIVDEDDSPIFRRQARKNLARRIDAHPIGDEYFELIVGPILRLHGAHARLYVRFLVAARHDDRDEGAANRTWLLRSAVVDT